MIAKDQKEKAKNSQKQLENFQSSMEKRISSWNLSIRQIENEVNNYLKDFQSYIKDVKDASLRLEELTKMLKSGEISEHIYNLILDELSNYFSSLIEEIFRIRENLELLRARAKIEWVKEKIGIEKLEKESYLLKNKFYMDDYMRKEVYSPMYRWQEIINRIDNALSSLTFEEELSIIERYLLIVKEKMSRAKSEKMEKAKRICKQRLDVLSEKWSSTRRSKIEQIMDLESKASQLKDEIKEVEVRFAVGEFGRSIYEWKMSELRGSLKKIEKEISEIRNYVNEIDLKIFKISELLKEGNIEYEE